MAENEFDRSAMVVEVEPVSDLAPVSVERQRFAVDSTSHDTTSILATIEHLYHLKPLGTRDAAVRDLTRAITGDFD